MKTNAILLSIIVGISQGVQPIIGYNFGAGKYDRVRQAYLLAIRWNFIVSAVGFCLFQFFSRRYHLPLWRWRASLLRVCHSVYADFSLHGIGQRCPAAFLQLFTAIGKALKGLLLSLTRQVFPDPLIFLLPLHFGIFGVLLAGPIADFIAFVVSIIFVFREFKVLTSQQREANSAASRFLRFSFNNSIKKIQEEAGRERILICR